MKRFLFSLLSLLVGVVLAGGVLYLNLYSHLNGRETIQGDWHGWPMDAYRQILVHISWSHEYAHRPSLVSRMEWHWPGLAANIAIALAIVFGGAGVCEWHVRRRATEAKE